jgi:hypothetical protein
MAFQLGIFREFNMIVVVGIFFVSAYIFRE